MLINFEAIQFFVQILVIGKIYFSYPVDLLGHGFLVNDYPFVGRECGKGTVGLIL